MKIKTQVALTVDFLSKNTAGLAGLKFWILKSAPYNSTLYLTSSLSRSTQESGLPKKVKKDQNKSSILSWS